MKKEDIIKWVLIAGAAYMVYRYLQQSGIFNQLLPGTAPQPTVTAGAPASTTATPASPDAATIYSALRAAIVAEGGDPAAPLNGWDANYWWTKSGIYNGVAVGPGQLGLVPMDATTTVAEAAKVDLATMSDKIAAYLVAHRPGVAGLIASGPVMLSPTSQVIDMQSGFEGFSMPSAWKN